MRHFLLTCGVALLTCLSFSAHAQVPTNPAKTGELMSAPPGTLSTMALPSSTVTNTRVGAGDVLRVTVFGQPDLSAEVGVNDQGIITLPLIGGLSVNDLTTSQIIAKISAAYLDKQYLKHPEISVEVIQLRSQMVSILGEVNQPGRYPIPGRLTVLELLATAGGLTRDADSNITLLRRPTDNNIQDVRIPIQLGDANTADNAPLDVDLSSGDVIYVNKKKLFYIHGEVNRPGSYAMEPDMNVMRAVSLGGGLTLRASERRMSIYRITDEHASQFGVRMTDPVQPGDVIYVKESFF